MFLKPIIDFLKAIDTGILTWLLGGTAILKCIFSIPVLSIILFIGWMIGLYIIASDDELL